MNTSKPNILLIVTDTQRWDTLRCMGNPNAVSPSLDRLAKEGVLFNQAHTSSPVCMPARCCLMSGLHTPIHGCIENGIQRRDDLPFMTDFLAEAGYINIMVGKAHFGPIPESFHVRHITKGEKGSDSDDFYAEHIRRHGYSRASAHPNDIPEELFMDAFLVDTTIESIKAAKEQGDAPFFALCSLPSPHGPVDPPGGWASCYDGVPLPEINYREGEIQDHPTHLRRLVGTLEPAENVGGEGHSDLNEARGNTIAGKEREEIDEFRRLYYGLAAYCDHQIGRLIDYLDHSGLRENTLVIFTSDHGQQYFDHGFNDKHNYYDSTWRVPFIMSMPGTLPQGEKRSFAIWNDITATILGAAGLAPAHVQGFDLFAPLADGLDSPRKCAVGTLYKSMALATERWKLEYYMEEGHGRLFDRREDPLEQQDRFDDPDYTEVRDVLLRALLAWRSDISDVRFLIENTGGGGPVARRIGRHTLTMSGRDAEERLNVAVGRLDAL